ncbi:hypothetical protein TKK_0018419 [Trichogramma kaykai]
MSNASETTTKPTTIVMPVIIQVPAEQQQQSGQQQQQQQPAMQINQRMLRSPSHESVTTDLSLFSCSSVAGSDRVGGGGNKTVGSFKSYSDMHLSDRGTSPNPDSRLRVFSNRPADILENLWFEEETDLIRSFGALSTALGLQKSFSTSDLTQLPASPRDTLLSTNRPKCRLRSTVSSYDLDLSSCRGRMLLEQVRFDRASRSCSTWVAVGDVVSNSQLPSPYGGVSCALPSINNNASADRVELQQQQRHREPSAMPFTAADLIRSVNKKIRQNYIKRRLLTTYRALERLSQSEFNLDKLEVTASGAASALGLPPKIGSNVGALTGIGGGGGGGREHEQALTVKDIERERGRQLSKYERNMLIFNWLHTLDDGSGGGNDDVGETAAVVSTVASCVQANANIATATTAH